MRRSTGTLSISTPSPRTPPRFEGFSSSLTRSASTLTDGSTLSDAEERQAPSKRRTNDIPVYHDEEESRDLNNDLETNATGLGISYNTQPNSLNIPMSRGVLAPKSSNIAKRALSMLTGSPQKMLRKMKSTPLFAKKSLTRHDDVKKEMPGPAGLGQPIGVLAGSLNLNRMELHQGDVRQMQDDSTKSIVVSPISGSYSPPLAPAVERPANFTSQSPAPSSEISIFEEYSDEELPRSPNRLLRSVSKSRSIQALKSFSNSRLSFVSKSENDLPQTTTQNERDMAREKVRWLHPGETFRIEDENGNEEFTVIKLDFDAYRILRATRRAIISEIAAPLGGRNEEDFSDHIIQCHTFWMTSSELLRNLILHFRSSNYSAQVYMLIFILKWLKSEPEGEALDCANKTFVIVKPALRFWRCLSERCSQASTID